MNRQNLTRTVVKDGYDPLVQIKSEKDKKINEAKKHEEDILKNKILDPLPIYDNVPIFTNPITTQISSKQELIDKDYIKNTFDLIGCEHIIDYEEAYYKIDDYNLIGLIVITDYRLLFKFKEDGVGHKFKIHDDFFKIPYFLISKIDKISEKKNMIKYSLEIHLKDSRLLKFIILSDQLKFYANLNNYVFVKDNLQFYLFSYKYREYYEMMVDGWKLYDPIEEYTRQGVMLEDPRLCLSNINKKFTLCPTYPDLLIIPRSIHEDDLREASNFRTKNRFPVFSYLYKNPNKENSYASIWRSSQTKSGITQQRSSADEKVLKSIGELGEKLVIYDARPYINALANRIKGGGFENIDYYSNTEIHFCELENIHNVRNAFSKIASLSLSKIIDNKKFWSSLEQTTWYDYIHLIIKFSNEIVGSLKKNHSVLVHCSDGWDRSSQLISFSEILIDPYYRTIKGVIVLIEKEWLSFGHQFALRNGLYNKEMNEDQRAPIFLQWLDCIHQLIIQFPSAFEYNMEFILFIAFNYNNCLYGTFMYNNENERYEKNAKLKTVSIWSDIYQNIRKYLNPFYKQYEGIITPNCAPYKLRFWEEYFLRFAGIEYKSITSQNFFNVMKVQDDINYENLQHKINDLVDVMKDIYNKTKDEEIYKSFNDISKFYLEGTEKHHEK